MRIFGLHVLTDKKLAVKLETARVEQRKLNSGIIEKLTCDNIVLSHTMKADRFQSDNESLQATKILGKLKR